MRIGLRELTFFLLLAGIAGAAGYFVFWPHHKQVEQVHTDSRDKEARLAQLDRLGETGEDLAGELAELAKALEFFESKLPNEQQIHSVLREVTQITEKRTLITKSVRTLKQTESADYVVLPIEMEIAGQFEGFYQFLLDLERMPRITRISQMELTKDKNGEGLLAGKMVLAIYFEPPARSAHGQPAGGSPAQVVPAAGSTRRTSSGGAR